MYEYSASITKVVDGDTLHVQIDPGLDLRLNTTLRLYGINCPELNTNEGKLAKNFVLAWLSNYATNNTVVIHTIKDHREKYGRYLAEVYDSSVTQQLNHDLVDAGHAVVYLP